MSEVPVVYEAKKRSPMMIKNLCPGLMEMGKIKIGNKGAKRQGANGEWQMPQKLDHFLITTNARGEDNNFLLDEALHKIFGEAPKSIPVRLIYDDISLNFATRYICYYGKTVFCSGDGEEAQRLQPDKKTYRARTCPCERQDPTFAGDVVNGQVKAGQGKCKINGILSVIIDGAQSVGGVWKFRTTSYNSVVGILSSLALIQRITGGRLAGIPMNMTVSPKTVQDPIQGKQQTIYVVGLQYAGTMDSLRETGYQIAMTEAKHGISMKRIEEDAMLMLTHTPTSGLGDDPAEDVIAEFYPEEAQAGSPALVEPVKTVKEHATAAAVIEADTAPPLAAPLAEEPAEPIKGATVIVEGEVVDQSTGEVMEATEQAQETAQVETPAEKQQRTRRTKAQMEEDRLKEEQLKQQEEPPHPAEEPAQTVDDPMAEPEALDNDKDFPPLPGNSGPTTAAPATAAPFKKDLF